MNKIVTLISAIFVGAVLYSPLSNGQSLIFAGFTFSGEAGSIQSRYPYLNDLYKQKTPKGMSSLSSQVLNRLGQVANSSLSMAPPDAMMNLKNMDGSLVTVLLVTGETVLNENYGSYNKTFINLSADALIFDYKNKTIVRSYPLNLVLFDASNGSQPPSKQKIQELILDMVTRTDDKGLISQYLNRLSIATLPKDGAKSIQVAKIEVNPEAYGMFPPQLRGNKNAVADILLDGFSSALSAKTGVAILPSKIGQALGMMTLKLDNSDGQIKIKIGDGDYLVNLKLNKYAKIKKEQTAVEVSNIYATSVNIDIYEQLSDQHFLQSDFKNGELSIAPINKQAGDDFPGYMDSLNGIFKKFADAIKTDDLEWAKAAASSSNISSEISKTRKLIESNM
jgi:hypothetical protein